MSKLIRSILSRFEYIFRAPFVYYFNELLNSIGFRHMNAQRFRDLALRNYLNDNQKLAVLYYKRAINRDPSNPTFHTDLAQVYYEANEFEEAIKYYQKALELDYDNERALKGIGYALHETNQWDTALYFYLRYLELDKNDVDVLSNLGALLHEMGRYEEAMEYYEKAKKLDPKSALIYKNQGRALYSLGRFKSAILSLRSAIELNPDEAEVHRLLGLSLESRGRLEEALESYKVAMALDRKDVYIRLDLTRALQNLDKYEEAAEHARIAVETSIKSGNKIDLANALWEFGWTCFLLGDFENSIKSSRKTLKIIPNLLPVRFNLALALLYIGKQKMSLKEYQKGIESLTEISDLKNHAIEDLKEALEKNPELSGGTDILHMLQDTLVRLEKNKDRKWG